MPVLDSGALVEDRVNAIRRYHETTGIKRAEIDISGGIDSAVTVNLIARAIGPENVTAAYSSIHSSESSRLKARASAKAAGVALIELDLGEWFESLVTIMKDGARAAGFDMDEIEARLAKDPLVLGSLRSCIRAPIGRGLNRLTGGGIRHGTGNECEDRWLRFYQKGGDGEVDTNPIAMLSKGEVYQLARALMVPTEVIDALPTPDLQGVGEAHNDEDELRELCGVAWTYSRIDAATGAYRVVGTIERMSRFMDREVSRPLLADEEPDDRAMTVMVQAALDQFPGFGQDEIAAFLKSARWVERVTRHKWNPNCPGLGDREELVKRKILGNDLPELEAAS